MSEDELRLLEGARTQDEWDAAVNRIKADHGGLLPGDWAEKVEASGLKQRITANFGVTDFGMGSPFG
jgi:hypothetical protein